MKQIYAVAFYCTKPERGSMATAWGVGSVRANSQYEAIGMGISMAKEQCPPHDGWQSHQADVVQVPQNWIDEAVGI